MGENFSRINYNKLYSGLFSLGLIYTFMTTFELIFFIFIVRPVITYNIHNLLNSYTDKSTVTKQINFDPSPMLIASIMNNREYILIDQLNFNSYLIIIIIIILLISLLVYLYTKIGIIENTNGSEVSESENHTDFGLVPHQRSQRSESEIELTTDERETSQISNRTRINLDRSIKQIYLKHAVKCAISTILCLIVYQIFFYYYGLEFMYVGSESELITTFVETIK